MLLAGMVADPAADAGEGNGTGDQVVGLLKTALGDEGDIALDRDAPGTGRRAGRSAAFGDDKDVGNGTLRREAVDRAMPAVLRGYFHRANGGTFATSGAALRVHIAGKLLHLEAKPAVFPTGDVFHDGLGEHGDALVVESLQQSRDIGHPGETIRGVFVPKKGGRFEQGNLKPVSGQAKGGLYAGRRSLQDDGAARRGFFMR